MIETEKTVRHKNVAIRPDKYKLLKDYALKNNMHVNEAVMHMYEVTIKTEGL
jgi:hypothetical protein